jgi:hypothetical protein
MDWQTIWAVAIIYSFMIPFSCEDGDFFGLLPSTLLRGGNILCERERAVTFLTGKKESGSYI